MTRLCYSTNVHPAEDLPGILRQLDGFAAPIRERTGFDRLGLGLWLAAGTAAELAADPALLRQLRGELAARGLAALTLNAFPYGGFHQPVVKHAVYRPDWTEPARARYTADCATVLAGLLPDDADSGSLSTLPLAWRRPWSAAADRAAEEALRRTEETLRTVSARAGRPIRLAVEPEPGCVLDTVADAVRWLAPRVDPEYVGLCLDTCHLAVSFADPDKAVASIERAGLAVVKIQASAALHVDDPADPAARRLLADYAEPRYLHQVRELDASGQVLAADDLPPALDGLPARGPWRVHFHVPLHAAPPGPLRSTTEVLRAAVAAVRDRTVLEVETYTWPVLPGGGTDIVAGIAAELTWAKSELLDERVNP
ncbi:metabolite traffic protein EboE [Saccharothrix sp. ST-888]|uniref:metabolite traffic protein EboE n=1 Tax=Saccharothrix sp. ST-888 TaxID=1427391 RepID=UPI0005ECECF9|nr:metabolite traffic protein EboE [Saccharothrix sp. ST-888]KJK56547.1 xylose isomerase [Saccharothrix sp. ST-888]